MRELKNKIPELLKKSAGLGPEEILALAVSEFGEKLTLATSLGEEDQVLTDMIGRVAPELEVFTLDTGRLFQESYDLLAKTQKRYPMTFKIYYPDTAAVEQMVRTKGINLFYESVENRKLCCGVRKVEPLRRALAGKSAWITGLRREQAVTRQDLKPFEWDDANGLVKINPLCAWTLKQVQDYVTDHRVDVSPLHKQGFISIGCSPCTRAVKPGEDIRAGRWWWEQPEQKECGLHNNPNRPKKK